MKKGMKLLAWVIITTILLMSLTGCFIATEQETSSVAYEKQIKANSETLAIEESAIKFTAKEDTIVEKDIIVPYGVESKDAPGDKIILQWTVSEEEV